MKVAVVGPGAMGCLFAARLANQGVDVTLVDYKPDRADVLREAGVTIQTKEGAYHARPRIALESPSDTNLAIVFVKAYDTASLKNLPRRAAVLTLQNGFGNVEKLCTLVGSGNVCVGITSEAATLEGVGRVRHAAAGKTVFGSWTSCPVKTAEEVLGKGGFAVEITDSPGQTLWEKVAISAAINPLTAILDVANGELLKINDIRQLMRDLVVEAVKVAATEGYRFQYSLVERAEEICETTKDNISSMLQDVRAAKRTEIDAITGEILERAQAAALPIPRSRVIYQLVKGLESR